MTAANAFNEGRLMSLEPKPSSAESYLAHPAQLGAVIQFLVGEGWVVHESRVVAILHALHGTLKAGIAPCERRCPQCGHLHVDERAYARVKHSAHICC